VPKTVVAVHIIRLRSSGHNPLNLQVGHTCFSR